MRNFKLLALLCDCAAWFVSDLVGNPNCWFCHAQAHFSIDSNSLEDYIYLEKDVRTIKEEAESNKIPDRKILSFLYYM